MYRCFACDAPALMNCACHTQLEVPEKNDRPFRAVATTVKPEKKQGLIFIGSGEDADVVIQISEGIVILA